MQYGTTPVYVSLVAPACHSSLTIQNDWCSYRTMIDVLNNVHAALALPVMSQNTCVFFVWIG